MINAEYLTSTSVMIDGRLYEYESNGVMPGVARELIAAGADPATLVHVTRNGTPCFAHDLSLRQWAWRRYEERADVIGSIRELRRPSVGRHTEEEAPEREGCADTAEAPCEIAQAIHTEIFSPDDDATSPHAPGAF